MSVIGHALDSRVQPALSALLARLRAWSGLGEAGEGLREGQPLVLTDRLRREEETPPLDPLTIAQWLWGAGFCSPGGAEHVLDLVKPFALNPAMSMLDICAGLGGGARAIAGAFGTYVTGLERDPELARRGMEMSVLQGMQKRAPVEAYDPQTLDLRTGAFDCILGRLATHAIEQKQRFLRMLNRGLKARGQLLLTDFLVEPKAGARPELAAWERGQAVPPRLWRLEQYAECLASCGFEIRVTEDMTETYRRDIVAGWAQLLHVVDLRGLPRKHLAAVLDEAEHWVRTIAVLESGALRLFRFYVLASKGRAGLRR